MGSMGAGGKKGLLVVALLCSAGLTGCKDFYLQYLIYPASGAVVGAIREAAFLIQAVTGQERYRRDRRLTPELFRLMPARQRPPSRTYFIGDIWTRGELWRFFRIGRPPAPGEQRQ